MFKYNHIVISRTDNIGDVILTLPAAGILKTIFPDCKISFLGKGYTRPVIEASHFINTFIDWDKIQRLTTSQQIESFQMFNADAIIHVFPNLKIARIASKARIPIRIGTNHRFYNLVYCNRRINLSRKKSDYHEAQLNLKLLKPFGAKELYDLSDIPKYYGFKSIYNLPGHLRTLIKPSKFNLILHPKSKNSAREWGEDNYSEFIKLLPKDKFNIFITGTKTEGEAVSELLEKHNKDMVDLTGKMSLAEFISFIGNADGILAASTGPLHIAAALGRYAVGLYAPMRPIHPGRWAPLGKNAHYFVLNKECQDCRKTMDCHCIRSINPGKVVKYFKSLLSRQT